LAGLIFSCVIRIELIEIFLRNFMQRGMNRERDIVEEEWLFAIGVALD
jgi:hypothetical protein